MNDLFSRSKRSQVMKAVRPANTRPELQVRKIIHRLGYRYSLHRHDLPGTPDIVFPSRKKILFINGCFWHRHHCKRGQSIPLNNREFWVTKFEKNVVRDKKNKRALNRLGWSYLTIWQCQMHDRESVMNRIIKYLES